MYMVEELKVPSNTTDTDSEGWGINATGEVAGSINGNITEPLGVGATWYGSGGYAGPFFSMAAGTDSRLFCINDGGDAVGYEGGLNASQKAVLVRNGKVHDLSPYVGLETVANGINNLGRICGGSWSGPAFVFDSWANAVVAQIPPLPGDPYTWATAINDTGTVVGMSGAIHAFVYNSNGTTRNLGPAWSVGGINEVGQACGTITKPLTWPASFSPGICDTTQSAPTFKEIPLPPGFVGGYAQGINKYGDVVGWCWPPQATETDLPTAFLYCHSDGSSKDLNTLVPAVYGWRLLWANAINAYGQITGIGQVNGQTRGFLLTPLPEGTQHNPRWDISLPMLVAILILGGVNVDGGGSEILPGGPPVPVGPWGPAWATLPAAKRDALVGLALDELAQQIQDPRAREAIRRPILEAVRSQVDRLLETPQAGASRVRPRAAALRLHFGMLPGSFIRSGRRPQQ